MMSKIVYKENGIEIEFENVQDLIAYKNSVKKGKKAREIDQSATKPQPKKTYRAEKVIITEPKDDESDSDTSIVKRQGKTWGQWDKEVKKMHKVLMRGDESSMVKAYKKANDKTTDFTKLRREYKRWLKKKDLLKPKLFKDVNIRRRDEFFETEKRKSKSESEDSQPDEEEGKYMIRKRSWMAYKGKYLKSVMESNNMSMADAVKYLGQIWSDSSKDYERATNLLQSRFGDRKKPQIDFSMMPHIDHIVPTCKDFFYKIIMNMVQNRSRISYKDEGKNFFGLDEERWDVMVSDFMRKSDKICQIARIRNKFGVEPTRKVLKYG